MAQSPALKVGQRMRQHIGAAPRYVGKDSGRNPARRDQRIAAVFRRREHHIGATLKQAHRAAQIGRRERRAIGADQHRAAIAPQRAAQGMVHAAAEAVPLLEAAADIQAAKKGMATRDVELNTPVTCRTERRANQALLQVRGARGAEARYQARLHAAGERRAREEDDHALSADRRTRAPGAAARRRARREGAAAT